MLDWKILAASFAALLVVSSVLVGGFGFSDILEKLSGWMGDSPLGGLVSAPVRNLKSANVTFYPQSFELALESSSFAAGGAAFTDFSGTCIANLSSDELLFTQKDSDLKVSLPLTEITFEGISLGKLSLEGTDFLVTSNSLDTSGQDATLEVLDFSGRITITSKLVRMEGNVTSVKGNGKEIV
jgi:hypothetical protein